MTDADARRRRRSLVALVGFLAAAALAAAVGALLQGDDVGARYLALERPGWAPPAWLFAPVWSVLYVLIGIAGWLLWQAGARRALRPWTAQLVVNATWPGVFFGLEAFGPSLVVILVLDLLVLVTVLAAARAPRPAPLGAALLVPYLLWTAYATALNAAIWLLQ